MNRIPRSRYGVEYNIIQLKNKIFYCTVSRIFVEELSRNREGRAYENANGEKSIADEIDKEIKKLFVTIDILFHLHNF